VLLLAASCRPGVGSRCELGEQRCLDGGRALVCEAGQFIEVPCRGKDGCKTLPAGTLCDVSANQEGDRCSRDEQGAAACADEDHLVVCRQGRFTRTPCRGPLGCELGGGRALCDSSVAEGGESCEQDGKKACSVDGKLLLACNGGRFSPLYPCRGARGCVASAGKLDCDLTLAIEGEGCDARATGHVACAADRKSTLICKSGRFVRDAPCKAGTHCDVAGTSTECVATR
jgi:hypothetical protein